MIHRIYGVLFRIWRPRRFARFVSIISPTVQDTLLDVGGVPSCWDAHTSLVKSIEIINTDRFESRGKVHASVGDGRQLPYREGEFSIGYSNSVIEHVGGFESQRAFAAEIRRVAKKIWVQTPAFSFPVEPHFLAIGVHWLPGRWQKFVVRWLTPRGWLDSSAVELAEHTRLLKKREMQVLFPDCEILTERFLGLPKSYIAVRV